MSDQNTGALSGGSQQSRTRIAHLDGEYYELLDDPAGSPFDPSDDLLTMVEKAAGAGGGVGGPTVDLGPLQAAVTALEDNQAVLFFEQATQNSDITSAQTDADDAQVDADLNAVAISAIQTGQLTQDSRLDALEAAPGGGTSVVEIECWNDLAGNTINVITHADQSVTAWNVTNDPPTPVNIAAGIPGSWTECPSVEDLDTWAVSALEPLVQEVEGVFANPTSVNWVETFTPDADGFYVVIVGAEAVTGSSGIRIGTTADGDDVLPNSPAADRLSPTLLERSFAVKLEAGTEYFFTSFAGGGSNMVNPSITVRPVSTFVTPELATGTVSFAPERELIHEGPGPITVPSPQELSDMGAWGLLFEVRNAQTNAPFEYTQSYTISVESLLEGVDSGGATRLREADGGSNTSILVSNVEHTEWTFTAGGVFTGAGVNHRVWLTREANIASVGNRFVAQQAATSVQPAGNDFLRFDETAFEDQLGGSLATFDGTDLVIAESPVDIVVRGMAYTVGSGSASRLSFFSDSTQPQFRIGAGNTSGVSGYGQFGQGTPDIESITVIPAETTPRTLHFRSLSSGQNQVLQAGSYISVEHVQPVASAAGGGGAVDLTSIEADIAANTAAIAAIPGLLDEDDFGSDSDTAAPTQQSVREYLDDVYGEVVFQPSGGDDAAVISALLAEYDPATIDEGRTVRLANSTPDTGTTYVFETTLNLRQRHRLVIPNGVTVEWRPTASFDGMPAITATQREAAVLGGGRIRSFADTPQGIVKVGPDGWATVYVVDTTDGSAVVTGTFDPVPPVGSDMALKTLDGTFQDGHGEVLASSPTSVTLSVDAVGSDPAARLFVLDGTPSNVLFCRVGGGLEIRGNNTIDSVGVVLQAAPQGDLFGTFENRVYDMVIRNVGTGVLLDAQANANQVTDVMLLQIVSGGRGWHIRNSEECRVTGGFVHNSFDVECCRVDNGIFNHFDTSVEPGGALSRAYVVEGGELSIRNRFILSDNVAGGFVDNGTQTTHILSNRARMGHERVDFHSSDTVPFGPTDSSGSLHAFDNGVEVEARWWNGSAWTTLGASLPTFTDRLAVDSAPKVNDGDATTAASTFPLSVTGLGVGVFEVTAVAIYNADAGEDFRTFLAPTGGAITADAVYGESPAENDASPQLGNRRTTVGLGSILQAGGVANQDLAVRYSGQFETTSPNASIDLRWAQNVAGPIGATLRAGSFLTVRQIS